VLIKTYILAQQNIWLTLANRLPQAKLIEESWKNTMNEQMKVQMMNKKMDDE
jgi:hypothetical protein